MEVGPDPCMQLCLKCGGEVVWEGRVTVAETRSGLAPVYWRERVVVMDRGPRVYGFGVDARGRVVDPFTLREPHQWQLWVDGEVVLDEVAQATAPAYECGADGEIGLQRLTLQARGAEVTIAYRLPVEAAVDRGERRGNWRGRKG